MTDLNEDGWPDFLLTRNNAPSRAYQNQRVAGRKSLQVTLRGRAGNPAAIGARITAEHADGSTQTSEVAAGSGYYSQSSASVFFGSPDANPLRKLRVRWPSGQTTERDATTTGRIMIEP